MSQSVAGNVFLEIKFLGNSFERTLHRTGTDWRRRLGSILMIPTGRGKQEVWIPMGLPEHSQHDQCGGWKWDVAIFGAFTAMDMDHHSFAVEIPNSQVRRFTDPQAQCVSRPQERFEFERVARINEAQKLVPG